MASRLHSILLQLSSFGYHNKINSSENAKEINASFLKHCFLIVDILIFVKILHFFVFSYVFLAPAFWYITYFFIYCPIIPDMEYKSPENFVFLILFS